MMTRNLTSARKRELLQRSTMGYINASFDTATDLTSIADALLLISGSTPKWLALVCIYYKKEGKKADKPDSHECIVESLGRVHHSNVPTQPVLLRCPPSPPPPPRGPPDSSFRSPHFLFALGHSVTV
ncbi:hypothetical protein E2C01_012082 [Portunus trituberculatus]|uniref:Uncharacterized protein n=1 Tax=Portunus trituberculatus TaxID=210409 RepID=A0A5B7DD00_PORTR|nr:hypothetical protein [Portunus trituberculatus]